MCQWKMTVIHEGPSKRLTVEAVYPSCARMLLAQLLMCLKRSGPNKIPPYHRDTTTMTLRTSRICDERQTHDTCETSAKLRELGKRLAAFFIHCAHVIYQQMLCGG